MEVIGIICQLIFLICAIDDVISVEELSAREDCPVGNYHCKSSVTKVCIALNKICDGNKDCPDGDDEMSSYCKEASLAKNYKDFNPGKNYVNGYEVLAHNSNSKSTKSLTRDGNWADGEGHYWHNTGCAAGKYLCNGTLDVCIPKSDICNGKTNCPNGDDENKQICDKWSQPKNNLISKPEIDKFAQQKSDVMSELKKNPLMDRLIGNSGPYNSRSFSGTGFMFHVDNMIIYNSDVKMFNQNSDNTNK